MLIFFYDGSNWFLFGNAIGSRERAFLGGDGAVSGDGQRIIVGPKNRYCAGLSGVYEIIIAESTPTPTPTPSPSHQPTSSSPNGTEKVHAESFLTAMFAVVLITWLLV